MWDISHWWNSLGHSCCCSYTDEVLCECPSLPSIQVPRQHHGLYLAILSILSLLFLICVGFFHPLFALHSEASGFLWCSPLSCVMSPSPSLTRKIHKDGVTFLGVAGMTEFLIIWSRFLILSTLELLCCPLKLASSLWGVFQSCAESLRLTTVLFPTHWIKLC